MRPEISDLFCFIESNVADFAFQTDSPLEIAEHRILQELVQPARADQYNRASPLFFTAVYVFQDCERARFKIIRLVDDELARLALQVADNCEEPIVLAARHLAFDIQRFTDAMEKRRRRCRAGELDIA